MFRPNLENPANKQATEDLNLAEGKRSDELKDVSNCVIYNLPIVDWRYLDWFARCWARQLAKILHRVFE